MNLLELPWLEAGLLVALVGAVCVALAGDTRRAARFGVSFSGATLACSLLAWLAFARGQSTTSSLQGLCLDKPVLAIDQFNAPLVPAVALLYFLVSLSTARTKMARFSFSWSLITEALQLAMFSCLEPSVLIGLLVAGVVPAALELYRRKTSMRVFLLHNGLYVGLLVAGWLVYEFGSEGTENLAASLLLFGAVLVRCGVIPMHCWVVDWFERASFGHGLLFVVPLVGVLAAIRLVLPIAPDWLLSALGVVSLCTAFYASALSLVQREARRFFAYLFLSHSSLVLIGLELSTSGTSIGPLSLTGALCLWISLIVSLGGFGLTLRALEARFGRLSLDSYHGLYEHTPMLAVCFLLTGLGSVGFPGTLGFVSTELLVDGAIEYNPYLGVGVVLTAALNGIALLRVYFLLFTGGRHISTVSLFSTPRERANAFALSLLILGGGLLPQLGVVERFEAAQGILEHRGLYQAKRSTTSDQASLPGNSQASSLAGAVDAGPED